MSTHFDLLYQPSPYTAQPHAVHQEPVPIAISESMVLATANLRDTSLEVIQRVEASRRLQVTLDMAQTLIKTAPSGLELNRGVDCHQAPSTEYEAAMFGPWVKGLEEVFIRLSESRTTEFEDGLFRMGLGGVAVEYTTDPSSPSLADIHTAFLIIPEIGPRIADYGGVHTDIIPALAYDLSSFRDRPLEPRPLLRGHPSRFKDNLADPLKEAQIIDLIYFILESTATFKE